MDWCGLMSGTKNNNRMIRGLIEAVKERCPNIFQKCPYQGHYEVINVALSKKMLGIYPAGVFKVDLNISDSPAKVFVYTSLQIDISN